MQILDSVSTAANYDTPPTPCTIEGVLRSNGGYAFITGNDAYMQLEHGPLGQTTWTREVHIPANSPVELQPGTVGVKFRDYNAGLHAVVSAALSENAEPAVTLTTPGSVTVSGFSFVQLAQQVVTSATAAVVFSAIPAAYTNLRVEWFAISDQAAEEELLCFTNLDTTAAHYLFQLQQTINGVANSAQGNAALVGLLGTAAGGFYGGWFDVPSYRAATFPRMIGQFGGAAADGRIGDIMCANNTTAGPVTSLTLQSNVGNLTSSGGVSSTFTLYGM